MMRHTTSYAAAACLGLFFVASVLVTRQSDAARPQAALDDVLYVNSPKVLKRASLGYTGLLADIYWTRAVQYFGTRHHERATSYHMLAPLLEITTQLDPQLVVAYEYGASFLAPAPPEGAGEPERAVQLMEYGIQQNPSDWKLYYDLGFVYYMNLKDYKKAADAFARGSQIPNAHPFLKVLAAQMAEHAQDYGTARMLWSATYQNSNDIDIKENAVEHLRGLKVDEDVANLQEATRRFRQATGRLPSGMTELATAEKLPAVPVDPDGHPYKLTSDGRVELQIPNDFPFATKGFPPGFKPPLKPYQPH